MSLYSVNMYILLCVNRFELIKSCYGHCAIDVPCKPITVVVVVVVVVVILTLS